MTIFITTQQLNKLRVLTNFNDGEFALKKKIKRLFEIKIFSLITIKSFIVMLINQGINVSKIN